MTARPYVKQVFAFMMFFLLFPAMISAQQGTGLQVSTAVDTLISAGSFADNRDNTPPFMVREAEVMIYAPIDQAFDGLLNLAAHPENGVSVFEVHEAYLKASRLIKGLRVRLGQFFLNFGRINAVHRHDWHFTSTPMVNRSFFDQEALADTGLEFGYLFPTPFYLDLTAGITSGWTLGHTHNQGQSPQLPTHYLRLETFWSLEHQKGLMLGLNYLGRKDHTGLLKTVIGFDATIKQRYGKILKLLIQSETWLQQLTVETGGPERQLGSYVYSQYGFENQWSIGLRLDALSNLSLKTALGSAITNLELSILPNLAYKASEFSTLRLEITQYIAYQKQKALQTNFGVQFQAVFLIGAHPAHMF